jgi:membrane protease YdiL (CAAX protease family)
MFWFCALIATGAWESASISREERKVSIKGIMNNTVRPIALALVGVGLGQILVMLAELIFEISITKIQASIITFIFAAIFAFLLFPRGLKLPFGDVGVSIYLRKLGFYWPRNAWKHVLLGMLLAACTLTGIWIASLLSGRYALDWSTVSLSHTIFSINPGVWEEFFYRGIIMFVLISATRSIKRAALIQILFFSLAHIKGFDLWAWVDVLSVFFLAIAFTYAAYKTRTLVVSMVFHFLHDAFLFLPQVDYQGVLENVTFYACLLAMTGVACLIIKFASERLGVQADEELYKVEQAVPA